MGRANRPNADHKRLHLKCIRVGTVAPQDGARQTRVELKKTATLETLFH